MNVNNAKDYLPLVQALAEGKVIQFASTACGWVDTDRLDTGIHSFRYRIKPEPRELWVNELPNVGTVAFESEDQAIEHAKRYGIGHVTRRYREVLE